MEENESKSKARGKLNLARKETGFSAPEEISNSQYRHVCPQRMYVHVLCL